jgi:hypothetical protein
MTQLKTALTLRRDFLENHAEEVMTSFVKRATGQPMRPGVDGRSLEKAFERLMDLVCKADDPSPMASLTDKSISERIDAVLADVAAGKLTPAEGKRVMSLLQAGFEMTELASLIERLEAVEKTKG